MAYKLYDAEIEYLQGTGTQYINTGIVPSSNIRLTVKGSFTETSGNNLIFGAISTVGSTYYRFHLGINNAAYVCGIGTEPATIKTADTNIHTFKITGSIGAVYVDEDYFRTDTRDYPSLPIYLFARNFDGVASNFHGFKLYSCEIYDYSTSQKIHDFIPVRVGQTGYLFDRVSGQLFGNAGTGSFTLGQDVGEGAEAEEVAYLQSTGTQYIDTGVLNSANIVIETTMSVQGNNCLNGSELSYRYRFKWGTSGNGSIYYGYQDQNKTFGGVTSLNNVYTFHLESGNQYVVDSDGTIMTSSAGVITQYSTYPIYLFHLMSDGSFVTQDGIMRIFSCKIWQNDTLVRDYVPVQYNGIGYMYDKVSGQLFGNKGTGKFIIGYIKGRSYTRRQLMAKATQELEYLEFPNGNVYFDSTYVPNGKDNVIQCKFKFDGYRNESGVIYWSWIFARPSGGDNYPNYRIMSSQYVSYVTIQNGRRGNQSTQNRVSVSKGSIYEFYIYKNQYFTVNGTQYTYTDNNPAGTNNGTLKIPDYNAQLKGRFYYLKWWKGDTLVLDWVPMKQGNEIFIYDKINKVRLTRYGSGTLIAGPIK